MRTVATLVAFALFFGWVIYGLRQQAQFECDVCFTFRGRTECRVAQGDSEKSAIASANMGACAALGSGVTDAMLCGASRPTSAQCRAL